MGNEVECADSRHVEIKKKSKKNKNMTDDPLLFGDENSQVETDGDHSKKKKKDKHREKKRKSELKEDGDEDQHDNGNFVTDNLPKKKRDKHKEKKRKSESKEDEDEDQHDNGNLVTDDLPKKKRDKHRKTEKRKSESKEDGDEDQHDNGNLVNDDLQMKKDKKRKRRSSEKAEIKENEPGQNSGPDVQKDSDRKPEKKKKKKTDVVKGTGISMNGCPEEMFKKTDKKKKKKKKKTDSRKLDADKTEEDCDPKPEKKKKKKADVVKGTGISINDCSEEMFKKIDEKKKKKKTDEQNLDTDKTEEFTLKTRDREDKSAKKQKVKGRLKNKAIESDGNKTDKPKAKSKSKRVSFSGHVEVFPTSVTEREKQATKKDGLLRGKRFTPEEDEIVKQAVLDYIAAKGLGDDGLKMVLTCKSHKGMKNCWKEIGICLPYRPSSAVYYRAHILFERAEDRAWTPEEIELVREYQKEHGNAWKKIAQELGKHRFHVKDTWRRIRLENSKKGKWSQEEYQNLYDLVNLDLQMKVKGEEDKMSKHGMLRDNIPWMAISDKLATRTNSICCLKWYGQLTSSLVLEKKWCDADDYRMIGALYEIDAACVEDVDWDSVLEHRPGEICLKRWSQMVKHIGDYRSKSFGEQVDILAKRYCPDLAETREAWDNKPIVT